MTDDRPLDRVIDQLPQKPPFLFVEEVLELEPGVRVKAAKTFPDGDRVFENHLPDEPLVPGVILIEALAQASGLALIPEDGTPVRGYLAEVDRMRFRRLIHPGERIILESTLERRFGSAARFDVRASVEGETAAEGAITIAGMRNDA